MKLFSEKVEPTFTNSSFNILQVENYSEIFFDVYEIELNKIKYPAEKISSFRGNPVVSVPVVIGEKEQEFPFVLIKGKPSILFNENNIDAPVDDSIEMQDDTEVIFENVDLEHESRIKEETKRELMEHIEIAKQNAQKHAEELKLQKIREANLEIRKKNKLLKESLNTAKQELVNEFVSITKSIKRELIKDADEKYSELEITIDNKIEDLANRLSESIEEDFQNSSKELESNIRSFVKSIHNESVLPELRKSLESIAKDVVYKISGIERNLDKKLDQKVDISVIQELTSELDALRNTNVELNNSINKGVNKALSRIGNVNNRIDEVSSDVIKQLDERISTTAENISSYYSEKLKSLEDQTFDINEKSRKYVIDLVRESRDSLISEIRKIQKEAPVELVIEASGKKKTKSLDSIEKDIDKKISDKLADEVIKLRKYIAVYSSGGGSVAQQFANGGVMNGNLTVVGAISASEYLGMQGGGGDFLPLSGGTVNGNVTITGTLSTTLLEAVSANITILDIKQYELSGFNVTGNATVQGSISATGNITANNLVYKNGNSDGSPLFIGTNDNQSLNLETNGLTRFSVISGGNIGIGTTTPSTILDINDSSSTQKNVEFTIRNGNFGWWKMTSSNTNNAGFLRFSSGNSSLTPLTLNGLNGNVGIGTQTPNERLTVVGNISATGTITSLSGITLANNAPIALSDNSGVERTALYMDTFNTMYLASGATGFLRIQPAGNVSIGSPSGNPGSKLSVVGNASIGAAYSTIAAPENGLIVSGNVGIGTQTPNERLTVAGNISATGRITALSGANITGSLTASGMITSPDFSVTGTDGGELTFTTDIRTWALGTNTFGPVPESQPQGLTFKPDGTMMFVTGQIEDKVWGYTLTTPWDITTATNQVSALVTATGGAPVAMYFTNDGLRMFILDTTADRVGRYSLTTAWNLSSATLDSGQTKVLTTISGMPAGASFDPRGLEFKPDGTTLFVCDDFNNRIYEISLQTAWDLTSTMTLVTSYLISTTIENSIRNISFNNDGTRLFVAGTNNTRIYEFKLAAPYSLADVAFVGRTVSAALDTNIGGLYYNDNAQKCFYVGSSSDIVREFIATPQPLLKGTRPLILSNSTDVNDRVFVNSLRITDSTVSSSATTGAFIVAGGVGVGGSLIANSTIAAGLDLQAGASSSLVFSGRSRILSPANGIIRLTDSAATNFTRLQFGDVTSSFPAIKRNGSGLDIVDAADTGFTNIRAKDITATGPIVFPSVLQANLATYSPSSYTGGMVYVSDGGTPSGGAMAFSDGVNWIRVFDNTILY